MSTITRIVLSALAAVATALLSAFWFWSMGVKWSPGEQLVLAVGFTIAATIVAAVAAFLALPEPSTKEPQP